MQERLPQESQGKMMVTGIKMVLEKQVSHEYRQSIGHQVAVRLSISPCIKAEQGNPSRRKVLDNEDIKIEQYISTNGKQIQTYDCIKNYFNRNQLTSPLSKAQWIEA
ncbi:hypothetical protein STEG23_029165, partial [Scotinomys teguina]